MVIYKTTIFFLTDFGKSHCNLVLNQSNTDSKVFLFRTIPKTRQFLVFNNQIVKVFSGPLPVKIDIDSNSFKPLFKKPFY
jgi:hypothetical protein